MFELFDEELDELLELPEVEFDELPELSIEELDELLEQLDFEEPDEPCFKISFSSFRRLFSSSSWVTEIFKRSTSASISL